MSDQVAIREKCALITLTCFHDVGEDGRPACRQGNQPGTTYTTIPREELPEGVEKCGYCDDTIDQTNACKNPDTLAFKLEQADADEVSAR